MLAYMYLFKTAVLIPIATAPPQRQRAYSAFHLIIKIKRKIISWKTNTETSATNGWALWKCVNNLGNQVRHVKPLGTFEIQIFEIQIPNKHLISATCTYIHTYTIHLTFWKFQLYLTKFVQIQAIVGCFLSNLKIVRKKCLTTFSNEKNKF